MTMSTFSSNFQDNYFTQIPILYLLNLEADSDTDIFVTIQHTLGLLTNFATNADFLNRESASIQAEMDGIFNSLETKVSKINSYAQAIIGLNSTFEDEYNIKNVNLYNLKTNTDQWEYMQKCLTLPMLSSYHEVASYKTISESTANLNSYSFVLPLSTSYKSISIKKSATTTDVLKVTFIDSNKKVLQQLSLDTNIDENYLVVNIPLGTYILVVDAQVDNSNDALTLIPLTFHFKPNATISLETMRYDFAEYFTLQSKTDIPKDCFLQLDLQLIFYDVNGNITTNDQVKMSINNSGLLIDQKRNVRPTDTIVSLYKDGVVSDVVSLGIDLKAIDDNDYVLYRRVLNGVIDIISDNTLKFNLQNSVSFDCIPTLNMYSLTQPTLTPKLFNLIGITKNASN